MADIAASPKPDKKRLSIFLDGTWNVVENNTNVWRAYSLCATHDKGGTSQLRYYSKGVGTAYGERIRGGVLGLGLNELVESAYEWLIENFNEGDDLFIFGFSRGAYAARSLAGLIAKYGILRSGSPVGVGELYERYKAGSSERTLYALLNAKAANKLSDISPVEGWLLDYAAPAPITMVGVWDTVGALIGDYSYLETGLRLKILNAFHALAIDEHRATFAPTLWTRNVHLDQPLSERSHPRSIASVEQKWFSGAHANVGGGYNSDFLPQLPLRWLMSKASLLGLTFREPISVDDRVYTAPTTNSLESAYGVYYFKQFGLRYFRFIGELDRTAGTVWTETVNETIDASVFERWRRNSSYRPKNIQVWASYHRLDPSGLHGSVMAKKPREAAPPE